MSKPGEDQQWLLPRLQTPMLLVTATVLADFAISDFLDCWLLVGDSLTMAIRLAPRNSTPLISRK